MTTVSVSTLPEKLAVQDVPLIAAVINAVWRETSDDPDPGIDAAFYDLIAMFGRLLPDGWAHREFLLLCSVGVES